MLAIIIFGGYAKIASLTDKKCVRLGAFLKLASKTHTVEIFENSYFKLKY